MMNTNSTDGLRVLHQHLANTSSSRQGHAKAEGKQGGPETAPEFGDDIFKIIEQAMQEKERLAQAKGAAQQQQQQPVQEQMAATATVLSPQKVEEKMYRVFDCNAINAPGAMYKAVTCTVDTTSQQLIQITLDRFGSSEDPGLFELRYAVEPDPATKKKAAEPPRVLKDADCPVMVAEWFTDRPRRFELYRKSDEKGMEKRAKKWTQYWSSPSMKKKRFTFRKKKKPEAKQPEF